MVWDKRCLLLFLMVWTVLLFLSIFLGLKWNPTYAPINITDEILQEPMWPLLMDKAFDFKNLITGDEHMKPEVSAEEMEKAYFSRIQPGEIVYTIVVCEVSKEEVRSSKDVKTGASKSFQRQLVQLDVLLKTAAIFAKRQIHFIVVTNTLNAFLKVKEIPSNWPEHLQKNLKLSKRDIWHPKGEENLLKRFRPCTIESVFIHEILSEADAAIYIDTNTFFLRSPEDIWSHLPLFNSTQMAAIAPCFYWYGRPAFRKRFRFYGDTGLNAGVIVMNITRMRALPFNLTNTFLEIYKRYKRGMIFMDQDIHNHFYGLYPQLLYPLNCTWNLRNGVCAQKPFPCESAKHGISLIHGPDVSFFSEKKDASLKVMFQALSSLDVNKHDIRKIPKLLQEAIEASQKEKINKCGRVEGFTEMVIKYPKQILEQKEHF